MIHILYGRDYYITTIIPGVKSRQRAQIAATRVNLFPQIKHAFLAYESDKVKLAFNFLFRLSNVMHMVQFY